MFDVAAPGDTVELLEDLGRQRQEISQQFRELPIEEYFSPQGDHWSPSGHLRHLVKSVRPLGAALKIPKPLLLVRFGWSGGSRSFDDVVALYRAQLAGGAGAGRFAPSADRPSEKPEAARDRTLEHWRIAGRSLVEAASSWREVALDRYRLPHPLLGKLTVREMLYFTLHHNAHHARRVEERRGSRGVSEEAT